MTPDDLDGRRLWADEVRRMLGTLPAAEADAILAVYRDGSTVAEASHAAGVGAPRGCAPTSRALIALGRSLLEAGEGLQEAATG